MTVFATNTVGEYGVPGMTPFRPGERREVSIDQALYLQTRPEFNLEFDKDDGLFKDEAGNIRWLGYFGPISATFGYGSGGVSMLRTFTRLGVNVSVNPHYGNGTDRQDLPPDAVSQLQHRFIPKWTMAHCLPSDWNRVCAPRKFGFTMWETTHIPDGSKIEQPFGDWIAAANQYVEHILVPCRHNAEVFAACGVKTPITVVGYPMDTEPWPYCDRPERETFTFVLFGDLTDRKGPREAVAAFLRAFPREQDVRFVLKSQWGHFGRNIGIPIIEDRRVHLINETWNRAQLLSLLTDADAFVWPSRGEGWGLPPLQAALTGLPVITTVNTAMADWYDARYFYDVRDRGMVPAPSYGEWFVPDIDHLAERMREVYTNRSAARRKGKLASQYVRKNFSLEVFARKLDTFLKTLEG